MLSLEKRERRENICHLNARVKLVLKPIAVDETAIVNNPLERANGIAGR